MASDTVETLLSNAAATGSGVRWHGGRGVFSVPVGTFGGTTVDLQWSLDNTNWLAVDKSGDTYVTFTAAGAGLFELPRCFVRARVTGGSPSGLYAYVNGTMND